MTSYRVSITEPTTAKFIYLLNLNFIKDIKIVFIDIVLHVSFLLSLLEDLLTLLKTVLFHQINYLQKYFKIRNKEEGKKKR
jgi:hypothetical protein